jgi:uncharacterized MAPEG superfamily protein
MKPELALLVWAVLLTFVQMLIAVSAATLQVGLPALAGNREGLAPCTGWAGRAARAHHNMLENLVPFAGLVLVAAPSYSSGRASWLRTAVWLVSVIGLALIFLQLV